MITETNRVLTYGEKRVSEILSTLPSSKFFSCNEPRIINQSHSSKPDFVIVCRDHGIAIVEVKDWVKLVGGDQRYVEIEHRDGRRERFSNPINQVEAYAYDLKGMFEQRRELFHSHRGQTKLKFPWQIVVILPHISKEIISQFEEKGIWPSGVVLGTEDLSNKERFPQILANLPWRWKLQNPLDNLVVDTLRAVLDPTVIVTDKSGKDVGQLTRIQSVLITEPLDTQTSMPFEEILSSEASGLAKDTHIRLVRGVAGSGKTLVLVRRVHHLAKSYPEQRTLVLTFNVDLAEDLRKRLPDLDVTNFHKMCARILGKQWRSPLQSDGWLQRYAKSQIQAAGLTISFVRDEISWRKETELHDNQAYLEVVRRGRGQSLTREKRLVINDIYNRYRAYQKRQREKGGDWMDWQDIPSAAVDCLLSGHHSLFESYDVILIDEAQDFAPQWLQVVQALLRTKGTLFICDDPTQSLFRFFSWRQKGIDVVGRTRILRVPFRCTREISVAAHSLIAADPFLSTSDEIVKPLLDSNEILQGEMPALMTCKNLVDEIAFVHDQALSLSAENEIAPQDIAILCHNKRLIKHWATLRNKGFYVDSFHKMKGLEFKVVFIPHLHTAFDGNEDEYEVSEMRRKVFTAMTRARSTLVLSHHETLPEALHPVIEHTWREQV